MSQDISSGIIKLGISEYQVGTKIALHKRRQVVLEPGLQPSFPRDSLVEEFARVPTTQIQAAKEDRSTQRNLG